MNVTMTSPEGGIATIKTTDPWVAENNTYGRYIQVRGESVLSLASDASETNGGSLAGLTLPAGLLIEGRFTAITLTSGAVRVYLRKF